MSMIAIMIRRKKYTYPQRATIGKVCPDDDTMMIPNEAFLKYFPDAVLSGMEDRTERSSCLRVGTYAVMHKNSIWIIR